ncbi:hypothetical protein HG535_0A06030 [Zygotorulaspora mrakii]|uniref:Autophagy protein 5 n=1 Tax=Zygotorulaspora mrakii TaxID=42260 RepID=A0A7H9AWL2_ZYGMR|nr:uncharacterized protein HG535_0A06030 [Zygotorulaspora mrakii]QLG70661.1 hypothetical protein HG535_0A06030 [Zygotorulaspora mrakii]
MDEIRNLVWNGAINVKLTVKSTLLIAGVKKERCSLNIRIPRDIYLPMYLPFMKNQVKDYLKADIDDRELFVWFEYENVPLYWNYPVGVLFDSMTSLIPSGRKRGDTSSSINMWTIELAYGPQAPSGVLPIVKGQEQIQGYWMHQWKQVCFILNGSAKQMMSLAMYDSKKFWESVIKRDRKSFEFIATKIIPAKPRHIPVVIHQSLPEMQIMQPVISAFQADQHEETFMDVLTHLLPVLFEKKGRAPIKIVCSGIEIPLEAHIYETYLRFFSFDGFLHISLCLLTANEVAIEGLEN